ncbi:hypothetical protein OSB04_002909 [Centaurea solstitialis]|uniref:Uncharacterized protein n=1 Tax=Centaurea solstitialis TaxID=347529 RepID=A0AA38U1C9_9ASTR|nr:hypothetical protein OSB04_002909 [Centaurea solstitialis]
MAGADANPTTNENLKPYAITNIKAFVPLVLDLNQLNYDAWRILFTTHCKAYGVYGHLDGTSQPTDASQAEWTKLDNLVAMWIYGTLSQSLLPTVLKDGSTAHKIWTSLESLFRDNKDTRAIDLEDELCSMTLGDRSITDLCTRMTQISDLLANIGSPVAEKTLVTYLLNAIHPKFDNVATLIRHTDPLPSFLKVRSMLAYFGGAKSSPGYSHTGGP